MDFQLFQTGRTRFPSGIAALRRLILGVGVLALLAGCGTSDTQSSDQTADQTSEQSTPAALAAAQGDDLILYASSESTETYLVDATNQPVHTWPSAYKAGQSAFLLADGSILRGASINDLAPDNRFVAAYRDGHNTIFNIGGIVERIAKDGTVLWTYEYYSDDYAPHHVATVMPNGDLLMPVWRYHSEDDSIALGRDPKRVTSGGLWLDSLIEVRPKGDKGGDIVWEWKSADHLIQDFDSSKANYGVVADHPEKIDINYGKGLNVPEDIMHVNSAYYIADLDQIVVTSYHYSELWVIDHSTTTEQAAGSSGGRSGHGGGLLYRWGNPWAYGHDVTDRFLLSAVHDPKWLADSRHFIMYDNNTADHERGLDGGDSMVVEIAPPLQPDGTYQLAEDGIYGPAQPVSAADLGVQATSVGTAQRFSDGRTLSCDCPNSETIWLDAQNKVSATASIWENTVKNADDTQVFRLVAYAKDDPGVQALQ
jgi:Arylsulfotransferase (ASST)